jgi:peptide/histidine transporter 3/4
MYIIFCFENSLQNKFMEESESEELTLDGSVDFKGRPAIRAKSGRWGDGIIILCKLHKHKFTKLIF